MTYALAGFLIAVVLFLLFATLWIWAKSTLQHWSYNLNRETHSRLGETELKLDAIERGQQRLLSQLERLERRCCTVSTS